MEQNSYIPLMETTRGPIVESVHYGSIVIVDNLGKILYHAGDPEVVSYLRSAAKPFQAMPLLQAQGDIEFGLTEEEIAIMCASHSGTDEHVAVVRQFQQKIGVTEKDLQCGTHNPWHSATFKRMIKQDEPFTPIRHMCSGKHTGMLAYAKLNGYPFDGYTELGHPVQQDILKAFSDFTGVKEAEIKIGLDGCTVPTFAIPLRSAAYGFARICEPTGLKNAAVEACRKISSAMGKHGAMVAGPNRFDTYLLQCAGSKMISKTGAEGYHCVGIMADAVEPGSPAMGIAVKVSDGDNDDRARPIILIEAMRQLGILSQSELIALKDFDRRPIYNFRHLEIGEYRPAFKLLHA